MKSKNGPRTRRLGGPASLRILFWGIFGFLVTASPGLNPRADASTHGAPPAEGHGAPPAEEGGGHGGGHGGESAPKPANLSDAYSKTGLKDCKRPFTAKGRQLICGTSEYVQYAQELEAYNQCIQTFPMKQYIPLKPCIRKPRPVADDQSPQGMLRKQDGSYVLDVPDSRLKPLSQKKQNTEVSPHHSPAQNPSVPPPSANHH